MNYEEQIANSRNGMDYLSRKRLTKFQEMERE